ncbi:glutamate ABC transporter substrate-binding protein [Microbacterium sp.]|uniref:glutamate ABC transporter substrate-binding protein n=1 Tax=Microbacterium sp. TaxID=51671 RepID=UPI0028982274|nr:glutamate ABC transporter substrate-binding protein [Microbacterium sp.]
MRTTRIAGALAGIAIAALALTACNSGTPGAEPGTGGATGDAGDGSTSGNPWTVATDVTLDGSPTFEKMTDADKVVIGVKNDQPGLGYEDAATGTRSGFDIDIARWIAASLGFDEDKIEYQTIPSANREQAIVNGDIDYYVGTYSITDKRKEQIDFAGPYFITGQGLLVAKDNTDINGPDDLAGKIVCSVTGSTPLQRIRDEYNPGDTVEYDTYSQCVEQLKAGSVDAITTDEAILAGYVAQDPDALKIAGEPFSEERYGVGLPKGDTVLKDHINALFNDNPEIWTAIFDKNLAPAGIAGDQPTADE